MRTGLSRLIGWIKNSYLLWTTLFRSRSLSRRILAPVVPGVAVVSIVFGGFSYWMIRRQIVESVRQVMMSEAANTARVLEGFFQQRLNDLDSVSETPLIADYNKNRGFGLGQEATVYRRELERYFSNFSQRAKVYYDIAYVSAEGDRVCSLRPKITPERYRAGFPRAFMDHLRQGKRLDLPLLETDPGGPKIKRYAKAVYDEAGAFLGGIVTDCDMTAVEDILRSVEVGKGGGAFIEDVDGNHLLGLQWPKDHSLFRGEMPIREVDRGWHWRVVVTAPAREYLEGPLRNILWGTALSSVLGILLLLVLIVWRVGDLMEPIHGMVEGTRRFAAGDFGFRFPPLRSRELDTLATSFNRMAETLEARNKELEQRLRQVTALRDMEEAVIQRQDEETVLRLCLEAVSRGFGFDRAGLYWVDPVHKEIVGRYLFGSDAAGFSEVAFKKRRVPLGGDDILNEVVRTRRGVIVKDPAMDPRTNREFVTESHTQEFCMAPICGKDRVLGILTADNFDSRRPFTDTDREGMMLYANAVGLALENAFLFQNLAESESKLRTVLENSPEAIIGLSREQWITTWNRGAEKIFGYAGPEALGKPLAILFPKSVGEEFKKLLNEVILKGSIRDFPLAGQNKAGKRLDLSVSWGGQHADFWMNKEWTLVIRDITESKRMQQQLIRSEKLSAVGQLISGIAHELNNPLQAVVGYSDILADDMRDRIEGIISPALLLEPPAVLEDLRIVSENALRCQKIIENLLSFVRQGEVEKKPVDLNHAVTACRELLHYKLRKAATIDVDVDIPPSVSAVWGNSGQIQQVIVNLVNNACDAITMSDQEGRKTIRIQARNLPSGRVRVEVSDNGPGIPVDARAQVFEPFFTTKPEGRGTGLGLPVCRQIVEDHGGKLDFTTELGRGTLFFFDLPSTTEPVEVKGRVSSALPPVVKGKRILLVDDEPDVLGFLTKVIRSEGNTLDVADSMKSAIDLATQKTFDLVVTDIRLGEGTGLTLFENWGLWNTQVRPPFVFMTGDVLSGNVATNIESRGMQLLRKPIDLATFQRAIRNALLPSPAPLKPPPPKS